MVGLGILVGEMRTRGIESSAATAAVSHHWTHPNALSEPGKLAGRAHHDLHDSMVA